MELIAVDRLDGVSGAQAGLFGGGSGCNFLHADGTGHVLGLEAGIANVEVVVFCRRGHGEIEIEGRARTINGNGHSLIGIELGTLVNFFPIGVFGIFETGDDVAGLKTGQGGSRTRRDPLDCGGRDLNRREPH